MSLKQSSSLNNVRQSGSGQSQSPNGSAVGRTSAEKDRLRKERESMKLWIHPITTIKYCGLEMAALFQIYRRRFVFSSETYEFSN